jgi:hypothetical protein
MPFKSKKQERLFQMIAHGKKAKGGIGPSQAVAQKFIADSKRGK